MIAARSFVSFGRRFAQDRDSLPQSDSDRAFHLVTLATDLIDYQLPFASDEQATSIVSRGRELLEEAIALDPDCHDAVRMLFSPSEAAFDSRYLFLREHEDEVRAFCEAEAKSAAMHRYSSACTTAGDRRGKASSRKRAAYKSAVEHLPHHFAPSSLRPV